MHAHMVPDSAFHGPSTQIPRDVDPVLGNLWGSDGVDLENEGFRRVGQDASRSGRQRPCSTKTRFRNGIPIECSLQYGV